MAALTPTLGQVGRMSVSCTVLNSGGGAADTISNANLLNLTDEMRGPLHKFLNTTFGSAAAAVSAFAALGGIVNIVSTGLLPDVSWALDGGKPSLALTGTATAVTCSIRITVSYSATR